MRRRHVLASLAALLPLAGCISGSPGNGTVTDPTTDGTTTDDATTTTTATSRYVAGSFTAHDATCGNPDDENAAVAFGANEVTVDGTIVGNDTCYVATLKTDTYDEASRVLTIVVESASEADANTACAQCITTMAYRYAGTFDGALPDRVLVDHERGGHAETVADVTRH